VSLSPVFVADLEALTSLQQSDTELLHSIELLDNAARLAVGSLIGWTLTLSTVDDSPLALTSICAGTVDTCQVRASLRVPIKVLSDADMMVLYAANRACSPTSIDMACALHLPREDLQLDQDLHRTLVPGIAGVAEWSTINLAVGVMVERGDTIAEAQSVLSGDASVASLNAYRNARNLLSNF
jgi:hypothetical protein